jgi:PAS domain S-box-containing protein
VLVDGATGQITDANPAMTELLGYTRAELIGKELWAIGLFEGPAAAQEAFRALHEHQVLRHEHIALQTKDGQQRDVELVSNVYETNGQRVIQCNLRDITRRKQAEDALRRVKDELQTQVADLRRLHELSSRLTATLDIEAVLREVLQAALAMQGTDLGLLSLYDAARAELVLKVQSGFDQALLTQIDGVPPCSAACYAQRQRIVVEDLALDPRFAVDREAARSAGVRACHSTPLITRSGTIVGVLSAYFRRPYRPSEREIRQMDLYARLAADCIENAQLHQQVQQELVAREQLLVREHVARAEAEHANRMKDEFLATVSHELRTPLTTILGWAQRLRTGRHDAATVARGLEIIERQAKAQARLVEDLLDTARVITGKLRLAIEPVDLALVVNAAIDAIQLAADAKGIRLAVAIDPSARTIAGDAGRLQQVVWNLLANAVKFTPAGGQIVVRLERDGAYARLSISDTGEGIGQELLPFIFDRFRQADSTSSRRHGGLGLGLAIVRHLVELHGGTVSAESPGVGSGATFTITLPLSKP